MFPFDDCIMCWREWEHLSTGRFKNRVTPEIDATLEYLKKAADTEEKVTRKRWFPTIY